VQIFWVVLIFQIGGAYVGIVYLIAALIGILLLESVNYIEHYGLCRNEISPGHYERVTPVHSWNSNHRVGRSLLFELSRHSDHHYNAARKYQILRHHENSPQMPTGYPGMILLALFPPFWFKVMNPKIERLQAAKAA
jgi:alkane 1-monooxygenase